MANFDPIGFETIEFETPERISMKLGIHNYNVGGLDEHVTGGLNLLFSFYFILGNVPRLHLWMDFNDL